MADVYLWLATMIRDCVFAVSAKLNVLHAHLQSTVFLFSLVTTYDWITLALRAAQKDSIQTIKL